MMRRLLILILISVLLVAGVQPSWAEYKSPQPCEPISSVSGEYWARRFYDRFDLSLATSDGSFILVGNILSEAGEIDILLMKLDSNGNTAWSKTVGTDTNPYSIQETDDGGFILTGRTYSPITDADVLIIRLSPTGDIIWQTTITSQSKTATEIGFAIEQTLDGGFLLSGETNFYNGVDYDAILIKLDQSGIVVWQKLYRGGTFEKMEILPDENIIVTGRTRTYGAGGFDAWVLKLNPDGEIIWQKAYGGLYSEAASDMQITSDNGLIIVGDTQSFGTENNDAWVIKLSPYGEIEWQKKVGDWFDINAAYSVLEEPGEGYYVGGNNSWIFSLDNKGELIWQLRFGDEVQGGVSSILHAQDNGLLIMGESSSDSWVIKTSPLGETCVSTNDSEATSVNTDAIVTDTNTAGEDINLLFYEGTGISQEVYIQSEVICPRPLIYLLPDYLQVDESDDYAEVSVVLDESPVFTATVSYRTEDISALAGYDYMPISGTLSFEPGAITQTISISIQDDFIAKEGLESLAVILDNPVNADLGVPFTSTVTITDDDEFFRISIPFIQK